MAERNPLPENPRLPRPVQDYLAAVVAHLGGTARDGQIAMTKAVMDAINGDGSGIPEHLLAQAGTGTGKSVSYLVPAVLAAYCGKKVLISTATIVLQDQIFTRDLPRVIEAIAPLLGGYRPSFALRKGRSNYLCKEKFRKATTESEGRSVPADEIRLLDAWIYSDGADGDKDKKPTGVSERTWKEVSVSALKCVGPACGLHKVCFAEAARNKAAEAEIVITNHAMLAINTKTSIDILPEHHVLIVDEAHEFSEKVIEALDSTLSPKSLISLKDRVRQVSRTTSVDSLAASITGLDEALKEEPVGLTRSCREETKDALKTLAGHANRVAIELDPNNSLDSDLTTEDFVIRLRTMAEVENVAATADRINTALMSPIEERKETVVVEESYENEESNRTLRVRPTTVADYLRESVFNSGATAVMTSATLTLRKSFDLTARSWGLDDPTVRWRSEDVASPFDYRNRGVLYVATHLPKPDNLAPISEVQILEMAALIEACQGRSLVLFSSKPAMKLAFEAVKKFLAKPLRDLLLLQGTDTTKNLVRRFRENPNASLFGSRSLSQGVDVPGETLSLTIIDKPSFPVPTDPFIEARMIAATHRLMRGDEEKRNQAETEAWREVFTHPASVALGQSCGRPIRTITDFGVVALLDPRIKTTDRYRKDLIESLPPFRICDDREAVLEALRKLAKSDPDPFRHLPKEPTWAKPEKMFETAEEIAGRKQPSEAPSAVSSQGRQILSSPPAGVAVARPRWRQMFAAAAAD